MFSPLTFLFLSSCIEPEPARPGCGKVCGDWCKTKVWPPLKKALTFTIKKDGVLGTALHLLGCLMAFLSAFTISYQVYASYIFDHRTSKVFSQRIYTGLFSKQLTSSMECELYF